MCAGVLLQSARFFSRIHCNLRQTGAKWMSSEISTDAMVDEEIVGYPAIKQKYPPGSWGNMSPFFAWRWHDLIKSHKDITNMEERLQTLGTLRPTWILKPFSNEPHVLDYQQYVTKTNLIKGMPEFYSLIDTDEQLDKARSIISDALLQSLWYTDVTRRYTSQLSHQRDKLIKRDMVGNIIDLLVTNLSDKYKYLSRSHYDEDVRIEATWDRFGFRGRIPNNRDKLYKCDKVILREIRQDSCFRGTYMASILLRTEKPLQQILRPDDDLCVTCSYPTKCYLPSVIGQPHAYLIGANLPGHNLGDPCEFGQLNVLVTTTNNRNSRCFSTEATDEMELGAGMVSGFTWLVAQAHYQGFSTYEDVTRPFCGQTIITDGRHMQFFASQLNTLALWKDNDANSVHNLCWYSPKLPLYDRVEDGQIVGLNDEAVTWLLKFLMNEPREMVAETSLPLGYVRPRDVDSFIDVKVEEIVVEEEEQLYD